MRIIWIPVADRPESIQALQTSFLLAKRVGSSVVGCHIRPHKSDSVQLFQGFDIDDDEAWQNAYASKYKEESSQSARSIYSAIAADYGFELRARPGREPAALWQQKTGSPRRVIAQNAPVSDLIVVSRPKAKGGRLAKMFLAAALANSGTPTLVLPQRTRAAAIGRRVCIAWNGSNEASRAVRAAMSILTAADEVVVLSCGLESKNVPKAEKLRSYLQHWGVAATIVRDRKSRDHAKTLIDMYKAASADLMVMGAYSRRRASERLFGGVTQTMLNYRGTMSLLLHL